MCNRFYIQKWWNNIRLNHINKSSICLGTVQVTIMGTFPTKIFEKEKLHKEKLIILPTPKLPVCYLHQRNLNDLTNLVLNNFCTDTKNGFYKWILQYNTQSWFSRLSQYSLCPTQIKWYFSPVFTNQRNPVFIPIFRSKERNAFNSLPNGSMISPFP